MQTRSQKMVRALTSDAHAGDLAALQGSPRVEALPAMLQRHGLLQVIAFLENKGSASQQTDESKDKRLLELLRITMQAVDARATLDRKDLANEPATRYAYLHELARDAATWLARLVP